jgi:hypothetical protein
MLEREAQTFADTRHIIEVVDALVAAVDSKAWQQAASLFLPEVTLHLDDAPTMTVAPGDLLARWGAALAPFDVVLHFVANHRVETDGNTARCTSKVMGFHRHPGPTAGENYCLTFGTFVHELAKEGTGWKIRGLRYRQLHALGDRSLLAR